MQLPAGFTLEDLARREVLDPELDRMTRDWVLSDTDLQAWEVGLCREDYARLARRWLVIRTPEGPKRLVFKPAQWRLYAEIEKQRQAGHPVRGRILKARQEGISTAIQGLGYKVVGVERTHCSAMTVAHDVESVQKLLAMTRLFVQESPDFLRPRLRYDTKNHLEFKDRKSDITLATAKNAQAGRSRTLVFLHCSEVAFWDHAEDTTTALYQAVPLTAETYILEETTAHGMGGYFHDAWKENQGRIDRGEPTEWFNLFIPWTEEPTYRMALYEGEGDDLMASLDLEERQLLANGVSLEQLKWRRRKISGDLHGDVERFHQEFPTHWEEAFISSGRPYHDRLVLLGWRKLAEAAPPPLPMPLKCALTRIRAGAEEAIPIQGEVSIYELPQPGVKYVIGADVSEGVSPNINNNDPDYSVADVGRMDTGDQVAELCGRFDPDVFGTLLDALGRMYNDASLGPEAHGLGVAVLNVLARLGYPNLYYRVSAAGEALPGWETNLATKPQMLAASKAWIRDGVGRIRSLQSIAEHMSVEVRPNGRVEVTAGHDDRMIARAIRIRITELLAPFALAVERSQAGADFQERLRRWRKNAEAEARERGREAEAGTYYDEVLGRV